MSRVDKPWGFYEDHTRQSDVVFKTIVVSPGEELSYQYHEKREEFWYVASGLGQMRLTYGLQGMENKFEVKKGDTIHIKPFDKHQVKNTSSEDLVIYEMQCGVCAEDDIVRIEDKYSR